MVRTVSISMGGKSVQVLKWAVKPFVHIYNIIVLSTSVNDLHGFWPKAHTNGPRLIDKFFATSLSTTKYLDITYTEIDYTVQFINSRLKVFIKKITM